MTDRLHITVTGQATTKGSMRAHRRGEKTIVIEDTKNSKAWRSQVAWTARNEWGAREPMVGPLSVFVAIELEKPKSNRHARPVTRGSGDVDKLARNILDALQDARVYVDDAQVVNLVIGKSWCQPDVLPQAEILVQAYSPSETEVA